ncbi:MAG TPA: hypothetical protein VIR54_03955 [Vicinamibacterales bacterium]
MSDAMTRALVAALFLGVAFRTADTTGPRFRSDDPLAREPDSQDAAGVQESEVGLVYNLSYNLFVTASRRPEHVRAQNVNTIDEVPDSSWFTNRIGTKPLTAAHIVRQSTPGPPPASEKWTVIREKSSGFAPGFTARDAKGETWFISFDPPSNPEGATGAMVLASKIFWALGYNQVETFLTTIDRRSLQIDPKATVRRPSGTRTPMTQADLDEVFERAAPGSDGLYRAAAGRLLPGRVVGAFRYEGTRSDDPNDIVPHEHRRELRALRVFGAWTNLTDMKAGNTLGTVVKRDDRSVVVHYLQDVGSTFGMGANGPHDWDEGWEYLYEGDTTRKRLLSMGFSRSPWQTAHYDEHPAIGRFEAEAFDPLTWKPRVPTAAFIEMRDDDGFWAARRVMAFDEPTIRELVEVAAFSDPAAAEQLTATLVARRDKIGRAYLTRINPIVDPVLSDEGTLTFANAAVRAHVATAPASYRAAWFTFDNATGETSSLGETRSSLESMTAPARLPATPGAFVKIEIAAVGAPHESWHRPLHVYFVRQQTGWKLIGLERMPEHA